MLPSWRSSTLPITARMEDERQRLFRNIAAAMQGVPRFIIERQLEHFTKADPAYGAGVAQALGMG